MRFFEHKIVKMTINRQNDNKSSNLGAIGPNDIFFFNIYASDLFVLPAEQVRSYRLCQIQINFFFASNKDGVSES